MRAWGTLAPAIALWLGSSRDATAGPDAVLVHGGAGRPERDAVAAAIDAVARTAGWELPPGLRGQRDADALASCVDAKQPWICLPVPSGALRRLFVVDIEHRTSGDAPMIVLTGRAILYAEHLLVVGERYCERCAGPELGAAATELGGRLLRELAVLAGRTTIVLSSSPSGAQIILDGDAVGATNATLHTYPGLHSVVLEKPGYALATRSLSVEDGQAVEETIRLQPTARSAGPRRPPSASGPSQLPPMLAVGGGAALLALGLVLAALDEDVHLTGKQPARYFDSAPLGTGLAITGAMTAAGGAYWWWRRARARAAPAISLGTGGATAGLSGTF